MIKDNSDSEGSDVDFPKAERYVISELKSNDYLKLY